jgi:Zn-dependent protease with chaperone function
MTRTPWVIRSISAASLAVALAGCAVSSAPPPGPPAPPTASRPQSGSPRQVDSSVAERLRRTMIPLVQNMNRPLPLKEVRIGIMDTNEINAANAGGGEFYVTRGLLQRANDEQLIGVMAHEVAHADLGHVAKAQALGAGLNIGVVILDQLFPGSGAITPIAGELIARAYTRKEEYAADAHGAMILARAGRNGREVMVDTLSWLQATAGSSGGGFFATHPATGDRIQALRDAS